MSALGLALPLLLAAGTGAVDLRGPWQFHPGGDPSYAAIDVDVDTGGWRVLPVPGHFADIGERGFGGTAWVRRSVDVPPALRDQPLALAVGPVIDAYDVWIDGQRVGGAGDVERGVHGKLRSFAWPVPAGAAADGKLVVAVRVWAQPDNARAYPVHAELAPGLYELGPAQAVADAVENAFLTRSLEHFVPNVVCSVLIALVGLASLALWLIRRQLLEHLFFGLFGVLLGWSQIAWALRDDGFLEGYWLEHRIARMALMGGIACFVAFVAVFLGVKRRRPLFTSLGASVAVNALPVLSAAAWPWVVRADRPCLPVFGVIVSFLVVRAVVRRVPDAVPMLLGVLLCVASTVLLFLDGTIVQLPFRVSDFGSGTMLVLSLSMAAVMMKRFGRVYRELDEKNVELLRLDQLKDEFMANTSHELRTPLNGIIGLADSLKDGATGALPEETRVNLALIAASGRRLAALVNDILDFAKLRHSGIELRRKPVDVRSAVDVVLTLSAPMARDKGIALVNAVPDSLAAADADEDRLQQILHNLVGNALKFTHAGRVEVSARSDGARLEVMVSDTGIGIPADKLDRIFESFEQGDGSTERTYGGTGLGLAVTKKLVELHGGTIHVASTPKQGSRFTFTLPAAQATAGVVASSSPAPSVALAALSEIAHTPTNPRSRTQEIQAVSMPVAGRHTVLVVDDEPVNLQVLENQLRVEGFAVVKAGDGAEALALLEKGLKPDAVILDVMMPKLSGYEVTRRIRAQNKTRFPIVLLTAKGREEDVVEGLATGANDYIVKPFRKGELVARLRTHLTLAKFDEAARRFVPFTFLELLGKQSLVDVTLGEGVQREMSVLFADIRSFTSIAEALGPQKIFTTLNRYLAHMQPAVHGHGGFINQVYGDGIMALFVGGAKDAVDATVAMHAALASFNEEQERAGGPVFRIGIGVNTGPLMLGTLGDVQRMECGVVSDTVNTAARVEGLTKMYGAKALVGETTWRRLDDAGRAGLREIDRVVVKGKHEPTSIYEVLGADDVTVADAKRARAADFARGLAGYRAARFDEASGAFEACVQACPDDGPAAAYLERCRTFAAGGAPADFDGVTRLDTK